ncbi:hypothetical protein K474DRAFT_722217 [Panus rudis PR-1116 ss-1]|nr:hypothetical protein K474DRAFT_722217 [Panus rudis PR-1116 ss-1]
MYTNTLGLFVVSIGVVPSFIVPVLGLPIKWHFVDVRDGSAKSVASSRFPTDPLASAGQSGGHDYSDGREFLQKRVVSPLPSTQGTVNFDGLFNPDGSINGDVIDLLGADVFGSRLTNPPPTSGSSKADTLAPLENGVHPSTINDERRQTPSATVLNSGDTHFDSLFNPDGTINTGELGLLEGVHLDPSASKGAPKRRQDVSGSDSSATSPSEGDPGHDTSRSQEEEQSIAPTRSENTLRYDKYGPGGSIDTSAHLLDGIISGVSNTYGRDLANTSPDLVSLLNSTTDGFPGGGLPGFRLVISSPAEQSGTTLHQAGRMTTTTTASRQSLSKRENSTEIEASMQSLTQLLKSLQAPTTHS